MNRDIVYILKDAEGTDELRYSLRSIEQNFPHRLVWFVAGCPKGYKPDRFLKHVQIGATKWERIRFSMLEVIKQPELSDEFYLFNDDFYVMKPFEGEFVNYVDRTLSDRINEFKAENNMNRYAQTLVAARNELAAQGYNTMNFEVHMPMLFKKDQVFEAVKKCPSPQMRSIYGNVTGCEYIQHRDVKVYRTDDVPTDADFLSTSNKSFIYGQIGAYLRQTFDKRSRYEDGEI